MDIVTYIRCRRLIKKYVKDLAGGMKYKGSVATVADLPTPSESIKGHAYTTSDNGHEHVCDGTKWVDLSADLDNKQDKLTAGDNIKIEGTTISADDTAIKSLIAQEATERQNGDNTLTNNKQDKISDLDAIRSGAALGATALQEHQDISGKLNVLPKVDDPTDPGYNWPYHIPYRFDISLDTEKANVDLHTLTLDNKVTKMTFNKQIPSATTAVAGLMSAADKVLLNGKQDKLIAGTNITIDQSTNTISASGGISPKYIELSFYSDGDTGVLTDAQAATLLESELNYIWLNGMHRLDFRYRDDNNNKATYSAVDTSSDGNKTHSVEINLTTKAFKVYHKTLQELISDLATIRSGAALGATAIQEHQDISGKQDKLTAGAGIVLEDNTISADVRTYKPFPSSWPHGAGTTIANFCTAVNASYKSGEIKIGDAFLGNVSSTAFFNGAYIEGGGSLGSAEVSVQIMTPFGQNCVQLLTTTSSNNAPYHWEYTYVDGAASEGWRCWSQYSYVNNKLSLKQDKLTAGTNITIEGNVISATGGSAPDAYLSDASVDADNNLKIQNKAGQDIVNCTVNYTLTNDKVKAVLTAAEKETLLSGVTGTTWVAANTNIAAHTEALGGLKFVALTQAQYDALTVKDANTLYIIKNA